MVAAVVYIIKFIIIIDINVVVIFVVAAVVYIIIIGIIFIIVVVVVPRQFATRIPIRNKFPEFHCHKYPPTTTIIIIK